MKDFLDSENICDTRGHFVSSSLLRLVCGVRLGFRIMFRIRIRSRLMFRASECIMPQSVFKGVKVQTSRNHAFGGASYNISLLWRIHLRRTTVFSQRLEITSYHKDTWWNFNCQTKPSTNYQRQQHTPTHTDNRKKTAQFKIDTLQLLSVCVSILHLHLSLLSSFSTPLSLSFCFSIGHLSISHV